MPATSALRAAVVDEVVERLSEDLPAVAVRAGAGTAFDVVLPALELDDLEELLTVRRQ